MHWSAAYVGLPYEPGARGPDTFDCWGLVCLVYEREYDIQLPVLPGIQTLPETCKEINRQSKQQEWEPIQSPEEGCVVLLGQRRVPHHVGVFIAADGGKLLHSLAGSGTVAEPMRNLRIKGYRIASYLRHHGIRHRNTESV